MPGRGAATYGASRVDGGSVRYGQVNYARLSEQLGEGIG